MGQTILDCDSTRAPSKVALMTSFSICILGLLNRLIMAHVRGVECMTLDSESRVLEAPGARLARNSP